MTQSTNAANTGAALTPTPRREKRHTSTSAVSKPRSGVWWRHALENLGRRVAEALGYLRELTEYIGRFLAGLGRCLRHPSQFRLTSLVHHMQETGLKAVPIVSLMAFLIGVVLAFQGSVQLKQFGAEVFVVDLIAISVLRELGILLTAIIVAGRTASALTASIGSMKMREEIDAMRTLGLDPDMILLVPRVLALIITLPLLGLVAETTLVVLRCGLLLGLESAHATRVGSAIVSGVAVDLGGRELQGRADLFDLDLVDRAVLAFLRLIASLLQKSVDDHAHALGEGFGDILGRLAPHIAGEEQSLAVLPLVGLAVADPGGGGDTEVRHRRTRGGETKLRIVHHVADDGNGGVSNRHY